jgi:dihydrofolate reductase
MRSVIVSNVMSIDGFFEDSAGTLDWFPVEGEFLAYAERLLRQADTLIFGRKTYEHMASYWPTAPRSEISEKMNSLPKRVYSASLDQVDWSGATLDRRDAVEGVRALKSEPGGDLVVLGSAKLAVSLMRAGLVDEYRVILSPTLLGAGRAMFEEAGRIDLKLAAVEPFGSGVVILSYRPGLGG